MMPNVNCFENVLRDTVTVVGKCLFCKDPHRFEVPEEQFQNYRAGAMVQNAFPDLDINLREFMVSGVCGACFDNTVGPKE